MKIFLFILLSFGTSGSALAQHLILHSGAESSTMQFIPEPPEGLFKCLSEPLPEFPGGQTALDSYLRQNLVYPDSALKYEVQGTVRVRFVVDCDGSLDNITVIKPLGSGLDQEAIRLVRNMPKWTTNINTKAATFFLPVKFYPE